MSQINLSNKIFQLNERVNLEKCGDNYNPDNESAVIAKDIVNELVDNAMVKVSSTTQETHENNIEKCTPETDNDEIRDMIDGLSKIKIPETVTARADEASTFDMEMKRLVNEMMSPPFEIVNYDTLPRNDGVGDQPAECEPATAPTEQPVEEEQPTADLPSKQIEKKSRITDLVMNSKKVLNNLLSEEGRKKQDEWEESNEQVIRIVDLQENLDDIDEEGASAPYENEDDSCCIKRIEDCNMDEVDLLTNTDIAKNTKSTNTESKMKKRKWNFSFKFFGFKKNRKNSSSKSAETKSKK